MSGAEYLRDLLRPLGVYDLEAPFNGGELEAAGLALDEMELALEEIEQEVLLTTAEDWGLERWAALFARRPVAEEPAADWRGQLYPVGCERRHFRLRHRRPGGGDWGGRGSGLLSRGGRCAGGL